MRMATSAEMESCSVRWTACLQKIGFLNEQNPGHIMRSLRRIFFRSELDSREVSILRGMLTQIDWASSGFDGRNARERDHARPGCRALLPVSPPSPRW